MFQYFDGELHCDAVALRTIADSAGTPCYVYSATSIRGAWLDYDFALRNVPHTICFAVKANSNLAVLALLAKLGSGFDIVSGGELYRVLHAGADPAKIVFAGVGKTTGEMEFALSKGIHNFNCESEEELDALNTVARERGKCARFSFRVNPDIHAETHPYISTGLSGHKFGIELRRAKDIYARASRLANVRACGVSCHIGSQILDTRPLIDAAGKVIDLACELRDGGLPIEHVDLGGGLGIAYEPEHSAPDAAEFVRAIEQQLIASKLEVILEPGRSIVGSAGMLLTRVLYKKRNIAKEFVIVDAGMNDLIRPTLYNSHHEILPVGRTNGSSLVDLVGPVCETGDFFARDRTIANVEAGDLVGIAAAGAYGFSQSSNYNSRTRAAEVLVDGSEWRFVRKRETYADLIRGETA